MCAGGGGSWLKHTNFVSSCEQKYHWTHTICEAYRAVPGQRAPMRQPFPRLVPRTRSSHHNCRESECELRVQSGTRIIELLVSFDSQVRYARAANSGELRNRD